MWLIVEALLALGLLLFIVWWTMFSGRRGGERPDDPAADPAQDPADRREGPPGA